MKLKLRILSVAFFSIGLFAGGNVFADDLATNAAPIPAPPSPESILATSAAPALAPDAQPNYTTNADGSPLTAPIDKGLRVFTCGNSFLWYTPEIVKNMADLAGLSGEVIVGVSKIGGSRAIQHWDVPADKNFAKPALAEGRVDILTLACMFPPDEGIANFAKLGLQGNPHFRIALQEFWIPSDQFHWPYDGDIKLVDFDKPTIQFLRDLHAPYFKMMDEYVHDLNATLGHPVVFAVPSGQAILNLREKIMNGQMPGIAKQSELFVDKIGHPSPPLEALVSYCNFAVIYRHSPVGLPLPDVLAKAHDQKWNNAQMNAVLQQLAWDAVTHQPLSGVPQAP